MIILYPGSSIGQTYRPHLAFTLGYAPIGSVLPPVDEIISSLPANIISDEVIEGIESLEQMLIESDEAIRAVESLEPLTSLESLEPEAIESLEVWALESEEPSDIVSDEPTDEIESEEPT